CKTKAPALNKQREQEITKLITSYRQTGVSLTSIVANVICLAIVRNYYIKMRGLTIELKKKNGKEQKQLDELQKKLLEKVKPGRKPSDIKRLKRSKSDSDLAPIPVAPPNLLQDQLTQKQKELEELRAKLEIAHQALKEIKQLLDNSLEARTNALSE
ncbi:1230_t:CDS:2, partial [Funneliformis geosporum]